MSVSVPVHGIHFVTWPLGEFVVEFQCVVQLTSYKMHEWWRSFSGSLLRFPVSG